MRSLPTQQEKEEMEKAIVEIKGKQYELKFTVGFWKKMKEKFKISTDNLDTLIKDDFGNTASSVIYYGIYYGLETRPEKIEDMEVKEVDIENELDRTVIDVIEQAIINGMTKAELKILELARKDQDSKLKEYEDGIDKSSKKK